MRWRYDWQWIVVGDWLWDWWRVLIGWGLSAEVPPACVNAVDTNAMERALLDCTNNVNVLTYSMSLNSAIRV